MDKRLILAVAGSGKTRYIIQELALDRRCVIITHTINNYENIKTRIIKRFGYVPSNIRLFTYFSFLYSFCFRPFLSKALGVRGVNWNPCMNRFAQGDKRFIDPSGRVYFNRLAKFIEKKGAVEDVIARVNKYCDIIMIDEIQDFSGHDFNFLSHLVNTTTEGFFVGDFFQHTFDTSRDGSVNRSLYDDFSAYKKRLTKMGFTVETDILNNSYRCSPTVCNYITTRLGIEMSSHRADETHIEHISAPERIRSLYDNGRVVKLFYQLSHRHVCHSNNWGNSKGMDEYDDVCIALNQQTYEHYTKDRLSLLKPQTRNKLYVAISRARGNVFFVEEKALNRALS